MRSALVVATRNPGKLSEFQRLLQTGDWQLLDLDSANVSGDVEETAADYAGNAVLKAAHACSASGLPAVADDSGIEVLALDGWPGPSSARWLRGSDRDRLHGLLDTVERRCPHDRRVRYVCAMALCVPGHEPVTVQATCEGTLVAPLGDAGFGYDPSFLSTDLAVTFGVAAAADKDRVSHRARAWRQLQQMHLAPLAASLNNSQLPNG